MQGEPLEGPPSSQSIRIIETGGYKSEGAHSAGE